MNYVVLVKQVPDIKNIPKEAWDWEKGILKRGLLDNICNELDRQALAFAVRMREQRPGKVVSVTMGPPFADAVLKYSLSVGADVGVLLTDRKLGGADVPATAYPLAQVIKRVEKEIFSGDRDYIIVSGMQSVDGDTAQVPPQVAEELGIVHVAYATSFGFDDGHLKVERITRRGKEVVMPDKYPCLVTVTQWTLPLNASFSRTRWAASQKLITWSAADVNCDESRIGLTGSHTNVVRIFSPKEASKRHCVFENDVHKLTGMIKETWTSRAQDEKKEEEKPGYTLPEGKKSNYSGEVWVYAEQEGGEVHPASFELLGKANELAAPLGEKVGAVLVGKNVKKLAMQLISYGADTVYVAEHDNLEQFLPLPYTKAVCDLIDRHNPQMMLFSATPLGRELAPRVAYRVKSGLTADCTGLDIIDFKRGKQEAVGVLQQTRPALGGNIMASIVTQNSRVQMSTARPGVMQALKQDTKREGKVVEYAIELTAADMGAHIISSEIGELKSQIGEAVVIVCGGSGCKSKENFEKYISPLAEKLGKFLGEETMVGASRPAVEMGFIDRSHQIGQTGQTVKPRLYVGVGVSGAVQHLTGMQNSDIILAINKDPNARMFQVCDFGVVGNLEEVVPELIKALNTKE